MSILEYAVLDMRVLEDAIGIPIADRDEPDDN